jgi:hypothetical protein
MAGGESKRASFNTRLRMRVKTALQTQARRAGRSLSEEIEFRLEGSLAADDQLGGRRAAAFFRALAHLAFLDSEGTDRWLDDWELYQAAVGRMQILIKEQSPPSPERVAASIERARELLTHLQDASLPEELRAAYLHAARALVDWDKALPANLRAEIASALKRQLGDTAP